jgi:hypothetical protein
MTQIEGAANFPVFPLKPFHFFFNWKKSIKNVSVKYLEIVKAPALISHRFLLTAPYNFRTNPNELNQDKKKESLKRICLAVTTSFLCYAIERGGFLKFVPKDPDV